MYNLFIFNSFRTKNKVQISFCITLVCFKIRWLYWFSAQYVQINLSLGVIYSYFSVYCMSFPNISHCKTIHHTLYTIISFQTNASTILILKKLNAQSVLMIRSNTNNTVSHRSRHLLFTGFCLVWKRISSVDMLHLSFIDLSFQKSYI